MVSYSFAGDPCMAENQLHPDIWGCWETIIAPEAGPVGGAVPVMVVASIPNTPSQPSPIQPNPDLPLCPPNPVNGCGERDVPIITRPSI